MAHGVFSGDDEVLIFGGGGFIGRHLAARCAEAGARVTTVGRRACADAICHLPVDLTDRDAVRRALSGRRVDYVFNLAGSIDHTPYGRGGRSMIDVHFGGLLNIVEALRDTPLKRLVQIGSSDEYGSAPAPQIETLRESPISPYSLGKVAATQFAQMLARTEGIPAAVLRLFLVYGPGQDERRFLPQIIKGCLEGASFRTSEGMQLRDFCYVDDVVDAMIRSAGCEAATGRVLNVASGVPRSIRSVVEDVVRMAGGGVPQWGAVPYRAGETMELYADCSAARDVLGWEATTPFAEGLRTTIDYYREMR